MCVREFGVEIVLLVSEVLLLILWCELNEFELVNSFGIIWRDNIDGCELEKDSFDIGERINVGFSGDEDEDMCVFILEDFLNFLNYLLDKVEIVKDGEIGDFINNVMFNINFCEILDVKEELESNENDIMMD